MDKYFVTQVGTLSEVFVDNPINPFGLQIIEASLERPSHEYIYKDGVLAHLGEIKELPDPPTIEEAEEALREVRNLRLAATDWTQLNDSPVKDNLGVKAYRAELRNVPQLEGFPYVSLPLPPDNIKV